MSTSDPEPPAPTSLPEVAELPEVSGIAGDDPADDDLDGDDRADDDRADDDRADDDRADDDRADLDVDDVEVPDAADFYDDDEVFPWETDDEPDGPRPPPRRHKGGGGAMLGAAMLGLRDVLYGKPKEETPIEIEASGDPPNVDLDGLDVVIDETRRAVGPPLDEIKARAVQNRRSRRRTD